MNTFILGFGMRQAQKNCLKKKNKLQSQHWVKEHVLYLCSNLFPSLWPGFTQVLAQQEKVAREEEIRKDVELCTRISAERSQNKRKKYFNHCKELLNQIVDLATKVGDYRQLTEK